MKKRAILYIFPVLALLAAVIAAAFIIAAGGAGSADDDGTRRNVYVGDVISLRIASREFSAEELSATFQGFEIVGIEEDPDGLLLSMRTFAVGERKFLLGNKEIVINVSSTLDDIERDGVFQGDAWVIKPGFLFYWRVLFYVAAGCFALAGGLVLAKAAIKRRAKQLSPLQMFMKRCAALCPDDDWGDEYFVDLTFYFKEYLEARLLCRIVGKTSIEIIAELKGIRALVAFLPEIQQWLGECDRLKFSGVEVTAGEKKGHRAKLLNLVGKIDRIKEEAA